MPHTNWDIFRSRIFVSFIKLTLLCVFFMDILTIRTTKSERNIVCMLSAHKFESNDISNAPQTQNNHDFFFLLNAMIYRIYTLCVFANIANNDQNVCKQMKWTINITLLPTGGLFQLKREKRNLSSIGCDIDIVRKFAGSIESLH